MLPCRVIGVGICSGVASEGIDNAACSCRCNYLLKKKKTTQAREFAQKRAEEQMSNTGDQSFFLNTIYRRTG